MCVCVCACVRVCVCVGVGRGGPERGARGQTKVKRQLHTTGNDSRLEKITIS